MGDFTITNLKEVEDSAGDRDDFGARFGRKHLDPEGIQWIRNLLKGLAAEGRTVFVSSHLMSEMSLTADHLIVIGRGKLIADTSVDDFIARASKQRVRVRSPQADLL